jgi:hypothetical protein
MDRTSLSQRECAESLRREGASVNSEGGGLVDPLCSRNARSRKTLVGLTQFGIYLGYSQGEKILTLHLLSMTTCFGALLTPSLSSAS